MTGKILRGRVLTFVRKPAGPDDEGSYRYFEDGAIAIDSEGRIEDSGDFGAIGKRFKYDVTDHRPHLIMPGFIDPHLHFVQMQIVGSWASDLMEWLNTYTFVEEQKFGDPGHAERIAAAFFDELIRNGTTTAAAYCSVHPESAEALFSEAARRNIGIVAGKCMMDRNCPEKLRDTPKRGYDETKRLIAKWHGRGRARYAITPRFAITSSHEQMEMAAVLANEHPECPVQTHLSENQGEIAFTRDLYPEYADYTSIYAQHGLLRPNTLLGHAIHLSDREMGILAETGAVAVSCPTSNLFLGSGLYDLERMTRAGVTSAVATDIGGGTSYSMFRTLDEFYKVQQINKNRLTPLHSFYMMTLGNAEAIELDNEVGVIAKGRFADLVILNSKATPGMVLRMETAGKLSEELFVLQTLGDDRAIAETYIAGKATKSAI